MPFLLGSADTPPAMEPAALLSNMRVAIHQYRSRFGGNPVGTNPEITKALNGDNPKQVKFLGDESGLRNIQSAFLAFADVDNDGATTGNVQALCTDGTIPSGFAATRSESRQLVRHGHIRVNGKKVTIPSMLIKAGDVVVSVDVNQKGEVTDARIVSGPVELRKAVLEAVESVSAPLGGNQHVVVRWRAPEIQARALREQLDTAPRPCGKCAAIIER